MANEEEKSKAQAEERSKAQAEERSKAQAEEKKQGDKKDEKAPGFPHIKTDTIQAYLRVGEKSVLIGECCIPRRYKQVVRLTMEVKKRSGRLLKSELGIELDDLLRADIMRYRDLQTEIIKVIKKEERKEAKKERKKAKKDEAIKVKSIPSLPQHID